MVDPVTDAIVVKSAEGAVSVGTEVAKSAAESAQTSVIKGIGEGGGSVLSSDPLGGTQIGVGSGEANLNGGPMPEGFSPDPAGGTQRGVGGNSLPGKDGGTQTQEKTYMQKLHEAMKTARFVAGAYRSTSQVGKDLMGNDAHRYDPVSRVQSAESRVHQWDKWH